MWYARNRTTGEHVKVAHALDGDQDWDYVEADADGWIPWHGGKCPLPDGAPHEVKWSDGGVDKYNGASFRWGNSLGIPNIIAYRPILDEKPRRASSTPVMDDYREAQKASSVEWNGEGLPPVGCRAVTSGGECTVVALQDDGNKACVRWCSGGLAVIMTSCIKPIRTAAQRAEDESVEAMHGYITGSKAYAVAVYHAIREGRIPGVKLEE